MQNLKEKSGQNRDSQTIPVPTNDSEDKNNKKIIFSIWRSTEITRDHFW
jgi:hypothetical protein